MRNKIISAGLDKEVIVDSVGFEPFHQGDPPDSRAIRVAKEHGIDISSHRARLFKKTDFTDFDKIYVMDHHNYRDVMREARNKQDEGKVDYLLNVLSPGQNTPVPDPWYGSHRDFENTFILLNKATGILLESLKERLKK